MTAPECTDQRCTRVDGRCVGMHCVHCGQPCSSFGHLKCLQAGGPAPVARAVDDELPAAGLMQWTAGRGYYRSADFDTPPWTPGRPR